jgi:hypothetical protein
VNHTYESYFDCELGTDHAAMHAEIKLLQKCSIPVSIADEPWIGDAAGFGRGTVRVWIVSSRT